MLLCRDLGSHLRRARSSSSEIGVAARKEHWFHLGVRIASEFAVMAADEHFSVHGRLHLERVILAASHQPHF
jgi:hypothetical protein